jgi:hypothetical protein
MCYDFQHGIINDEEDVTFIIEPMLFSLLEELQYQLNHGWNQMLYHQENIKI